MQGCAKEAEPAYGSIKEGSLGEVLIIGKRGSRRGAFLLFFAVRFSMGNFTPLIDKHDRPMATGIEIVGAIAASIELVKLAKKGLTIFNKIRHVALISTELKEWQFRTVTQGVKFEWWCSTLRIQEMIELGKENPQWQDTEEFQRYQKNLETELRFKSEDMVRLTIDMVKNMNHKFEETNKIFSRYFESQCTPPFDGKRGKLGSTWNRFSTKLRAESTSKKGFPADSRNEQTISHVTALSATARWLTTDKNAIGQLLSAIEALNDSLVNLLQYSRGSQVIRRKNMAILDHTDYHTLALIQTLPDEHGLKSLASMKKWQIHEQKHQDGGATSNMSTSTLEAGSSKARVHTYPIQDFKRNTLRVGESRSLSMLDEQPVVVEWKYFSKDQPFWLEQSVRLSNLVSILNRNNLFDKLMAIPCKGLVSDNENSRIGVVFSPKSSDQVTLTTLRDMMRSTAQTPPPLGERFDLAKRFSLGLSSLHSVRWLHKSIRSDNFISFQQTSAKSSPDPTNMSVLHTESAIEAINNDISCSFPTRPLTIAPAPLPTFYLLGWDLSRPDHPSELSETLSVSTSGYQSKRDIIQMYTHPDASRRADDTPRTRYCPRFDIYSMGLVLLEIGLWRTIDVMRSKCKNDDDFRSRIQTEYCDKLQSKMGLTYWRAVQRCLSNDFDVSGENDFDLQLAFEKQVVSELESCSV